MKVLRSDVVANRDVLAPDDGAVVREPLAREDGRLGHGPLDGDAILRHVGRRYVERLARHVQDGLKSERPT